LTPLLPVSALSEGQMVACRAGDREVLVCLVEGQYYALENCCSHAGQRLSSGRLKGYELSCPLHRAKFDVRTGTALSAPATEPIASYPVILEGGKVKVTLA